ncbi:hypothetical protein ACFLSH_00405 [Bacteroidota bacterium]
MKFLFSLLSLSLIPIFCYAQITIEETVEINPQVFQSDDPTQTHTIQFDLQWDTPQYNVFIWVMSIPCQTVNHVDWQSGGTISLTIDNAMPGYYDLQPRFNVPYGVTTNVTYQFYLNGSLVFEGAREIAGRNSSFPYFDIRYTPPLVSNFNFNINNINGTCSSEHTSMELSAFSVPGCTPVSNWNENTEPLYLSFTSGGEFASFYDGNQQMIGDNFSGTLSQLRDMEIDIMHDNIYLGTEDKYLLVQCEWGGIVKTDSVQIFSEIYTMIKEILPDSTERLVTGDWAELRFRYFNRCEYLPSETKYNLEIVQGLEYGNLEHPDTFERVKALTNLDHYHGIHYAYYIADGISPEETATVVFRISTTDPAFEPAELTLYIKPPPIYAYTVPDVLGADDTADVIIKHRLEDGTLEDFPPEQTFELSVLDGCVNGNFLVGTDIDAYFAQAQQPIKFVTADSLDEEYDKVNIRISTELEGSMRPLGNRKEKEKLINEQQREPMGNTGDTISELRAGFNRMIAEKKTKAEAEKNEGNTPPLEVPIVSACALEDDYDFNFWQGDVGVGYFCNTTRPLLVEEIKNSVITEVTDTEDMLDVKQKEDNYVGEDNQGGCNNNQDEGGWATGYTVIHDYPLHFTYYYITEMTFYLTWGFCIDEINDIYSDPILIDLQNGILTGIQNIREKKDIIKDFESILNGYSEGRGIKYYPIAETREHELKHISQYKYTIKKLFDMALSEINWVEEPPLDWCSTAESSEKYVNERKAEFDRFLNDAEVAYTEEMKLTKAEREAEADKIGLEYLKNTLIPKVKSFPY